MKSYLNQCAKCESKFTSADKPLKLLPCLHSMCIDCLQGRSPKRKPKCVNNENSDKSGTSKTENKESESPQVGEKSNQDSEEDKKSNGEATKDAEQSLGTTEDTKPAAENDLDLPNTNSKDNANGDSGKSTSTPGSGHETSSSVNKEHKENEEGKISAVEAASSGLETEESERIEEQELKCKPATECPVCRDSIEQPSVDLLDNMFAVLDPGQEVEPVGEVNHVCTGCEDGQTAESYCVQCEEWLCSSCVHAHRRVRVTKDHVISPKDEVKIVSSRSPWEHLMTCTQHKPEQLKFFCEKCEKLTCRDCQLMDHKDHKYQFLDQAAEQYKARLKGSLALMGEKRNKLSSNKEEIEQKLANCKEQKETLQQEILKQADVLVKGIRQAVWGVLSNLGSFTEAATKRLNKEIDDVSDLVMKFDDCIQFMEDILSEGSSMSLLYSKVNVETKCRKVYHTQVDPQSLKGTLLIQYKHDVNWLLGNLNKVGAIFVNGVRYPPDKSNGQSRQAGHNLSESRGGAPMNATSPHLQHMANQSIPGQRLQQEWAKYIQSMPKLQSGAPPNMTMNSLPPQLALPNRRGQHTHTWQMPSMGNDRNFPGQFVAGQLVTPQQQGSRPSFAPMKLHHRPATHQGDHSPGILRSPPQYRQGGEASGTSRSSSTQGTPDPARPASAGMYDGGSSSRPDSGGSVGGLSAMEIKKEKHDLSPDCVVMSLKGDRSSVFQSTPPGSKSTDMMEMQKNLDDVLRAVSMDMSENLEQISHPPKTSDKQKKQATPPPTAHVTNNTGHSTEKEGQAHPGPPESPSDQELRDNWQGGNSMPGFSLSQVGSLGDPNDDYCACCHNGGDVLCCDECPRVYHLQCHIPELGAVPSGSFVCTLCVGDNPVAHEDVTSNLKRKAPGGLMDQEVKVCERILLELFCHPSSVPFQEPVNRVQVPNYYKIISQPMDFTQIKCKLQRRHHNHYQSLKAYLYDLRQVFINCALYNKAESDVGKAGKVVRELLESLVARLIPQHLAFVKENPTPCFSALQRMADPEIAPAEVNGDGTVGPTSPKRPKVD